MTNRVRIPKDPPIIPGARDPKTPLRRAMAIAVEQAGNLPILRVKTPGHALDPIARAMIVPIRTALIPILGQEAAKAARGSMI